MNVGEILKTVGSGILSAHPLGKVALSVIGAVTGKEPDPNVTGYEAMSEIDALPPEQRDKLLTAKIQADVEHDKQWTERFTVMTKVSGWGWVRPFIVLQFSFLVTVASMYYLYMMHLAISSAVEENPAMSVGASIGLAVSAVGNTWPAIVSVLALPIAIIRSWFGFREQGKIRAAAAATGQQLPQMEGMLSGIKKLFS